MEQAHAEAVRAIPSTLDPLPSLLPLRPLPPQHFALPLCRLHPKSRTPTRKPQTLKQVKDMAEVHAGMVSGMDEAHVSALAAEQLEMDRALASAEDARLAVEVPYHPC